MFAIILQDNFLINGISKIFFNFIVEFQLWTGLDCISYEMKKL